MSIQMYNYAELYRSPQAAYIQVEPKLEKLLAHDEKVQVVYSTCVQCSMIALLS